MLLLSRKMHVHMKSLLVSAILAGFAAAVLVTVVQAQSDKCASPYVWREAFPGDHVCVTTDTRAQVIYDNLHASERIDPESIVNAVWGGETCLSPYVPRLASHGDSVCVTQATQYQTAIDNSQAKYRLAYAYADDRRWDYPRWGGVDGNRIDWCLNFGSGCGQPAADRFCNRERYLGARYFAQDPDIGVWEPTTVSGTGEVCNQSSCDGFKYITCYGRLFSANESSTSQEAAVYKNPSWKGRPLDACYWNTECDGKVAAKAFCLLSEPAKDFTRSLYFRLNPDRSNDSTIMIGTNMLCTKNCRGFQIIICQ